jgi:hypothetical protein
MSEEIRSSLMKNFVVVLVLAVVGLALPHPSQAAGVMMGVPGYYDPTTSTFVPIVTPKTFPLATFTRTGTFKLTVTLSIEPAIGVDEPITCQASISTFDASFTNSASTTGLIVRSGAKGTLTMPIPYNWTTAAAGETATVTVNCSENSFGAGGIGHSISFTVPGFVVPSTPNAVTTKSLTGSM